MQAINDRIVTLITALNLLEEEIKDKPLNYDELVEEQERLVNELTRIRNRI